MQSPIDPTSSWHRRSCPLSALCLVELKMVCFLNVCIIESVQSKRWFYPSMLTIFFFFFLCKQGPVNEVSTCSMSHRFFRESRGHHTSPVKMFANRIKIESSNQYFRQSKDQGDFRTAKINGLKAPRKHDYLLFPLNHCKPSNQKLWKRAIKWSSNQRSRSGFKMLQQATC